MQKIFCDVCKKEIVTETHGVITFPKTINSIEQIVIQWHHESDVCQKCMIEIARFVNVEMKDDQKE